MLLHSGALGMNCHPEGASAMRRISTEDPRRSFTSCYSVQDDIETKAYSPLEGSFQRLKNWWKSLGGQEMLPFVLLGSG